MVRANNEDSFCIGSAAKKRMLFAVADGMGGHNAGEVASSIAVEIMQKRAEAASSADSARDILRKGVAEANSVIYSTAAADEKLSNMGTTLTAVIADEKSLCIVNVGDSRAYLYSDGELKQITRDHSYVQELINEGLLTKQEADVHPDKNYITRSLGIDSEVEEDLYAPSWKQGDKLLLCTDGLTNNVPDEELLRVLSSFSTPEFAAETLIKLANAHGGGDNITVIAVFNDGEPAKGGDR